MNKNIAVIFKSVRKFLGLQQTEMSAILGTTQGTISKIESAAMKTEMSLWFDFVRKFGLKDPYCCLYGGLELKRLDDICIRDFKSPLIPNKIFFYDEKYFLVKDIRPLFDYLENSSPQLLKELTNKHEINAGIFHINNHPLPSSLVEDIFTIVNKILINKKIQKLNLNFSSSFSCVVDVDELLDFKSMLLLFQKESR